MEKNLAVASGLFSITTAGQEPESGLNATPSKAYYELIVLVRMHTSCPAMLRIIFA